MSEIYLRVFLNRSELVQSDGTTEVFLEGRMSPSAQERKAHIETTLEDGYLEKQILRCRDKLEGLDFSPLKPNYRDILTNLLDSVTSEVGRAIVGLTILQLCVKAIEPNQSIRLHKGSQTNTGFSWQEGISMRSLDGHYITPILRKYDLLRLNADGFMMTRTLAENYPYSPLYKANIRGARREWMEIVEAIECSDIEPKTALHYLLSQLLNRAKAFQTLAQETVVSLHLFRKSLPRYFTREQVTQMICKHINYSNYAARIMEISMHSLMQAMEEAQVFEVGKLKPLSQMRSANKKHGNIGDIEIVEGKEIIEAWDAKYGKSYLRDELEEMVEKLEIHPEVVVTGFVTSAEPERLEELKSRRKEIEDYMGVSIDIMSFKDWIKKQFSRTLTTGGITEHDLAMKWLIAYTESLAQYRRNIAPIDEPCQHWLESLKVILEECTLK